MTTLTSLSLPRTLLIGIFVVVSLISASAQEWTQYNSPEEAGWDSGLLEDAFEYADEIGSSAFMIIYNGRIVATNGDITRRFMCHSVRKSLLSALYGIYVENGTIDLDSDLASLGIDDIYELTDQEKSTTIGNMLKARSGVYHPAAYETPEMAAARPARGSHAPGTFWYYNNWDFNTLCTILMNATGVDFFEDFEQKIAIPLGMEDFSLDHTYYHLEPEHSKYPAYPFRMSARDLARIGQLYLQNGRWNGQKVLSPDWVEETSTPYSHNPQDGTMGYGYMWWTGLYGVERPNYSAQGVGNQAVIVFPMDNVVMVNRANTWDGERVSNSDLRSLVDLVWKARIGQWKAEPKYSDFNPQTQRVPTAPSPVSMTQKEKSEYCREYTLEDFTIEIVADGKDLKLLTPMAGNFVVFPIGEDKFRVKDAHWTLQVGRDENGKLDGSIEQL